MDELAPDRIEEFVGPSLVFREYRVFEEIESTNSYLRNLAANERPGLVVVAGHQTGGRGREGRQWLSPPGSSVSCSVLLRPNLPRDQLYLLGAACGLAVRDGIAPFVLVPPRLKWPNDVLLDQGKVCGILAETTTVRGEGLRAIVGFGINVHAAPPPDVTPNATCVDAHAARPVTRLEVLGGALRAYSGLITRLYGGDLDSIWSQWRGSLRTLGQRVSVRAEGGMVTGKALDVARDGALILEREPDGEFRMIYAGDAIER